MGFETRKNRSTTSPGILAHDDIVGSVADNDDVLVHLRKMINRTDCSNLKFVCEDGVHVRANKIFLVGRSGVLDTMLTNGMRETNSTVINLPEISSAAFLSILEFLYTGNLVDYQPTNWEMAYKIINAADFFLLQGVEKIAREYVWTHLSNILEGSHRAATMLNVALESNVCRHDEDAALLQLVHILDQEWMHEDCVCKFSEHAMVFIMRHTKPKLESRFTLSLDEYFRFRGVLLWCLFNSHFLSRKATFELVNQALPLTTDELYRKGSVESGRMNFGAWNEIDGTQDAILRFFASDQDCRQSAIRLLTHVNWVCIPPRVLIRFVEPLKLLSDSQLLDIFRFHSLHRQNVYSK